MPIAPPTPLIPFDIANQAMDFARMRFNDCPLAISGNLLANTQPYAQTVYNAGWRSFQRALAQAGDPAQTEEVIIPGLPVVASVDPAVRVYLSQAGYWNGQELFVPPVIGVLPSNLIQPLWCQERQAGTIQPFVPMQPCDDGIPDGPKVPWLRQWEWRIYRIYMPGATTPRDLKIRFATYLPDAETIGVTPWYEQPIPILHSADVLSFYVVAEFAFSRGSEQAKAIGNSFLASGQQAMREQMNATTNKVRQRINHRRRSYSQNRHRGWGFW